MDHLKFKSRNLHIIYEIEKISQPPQKQFEIRKTYKNEYDTCKLGQIIPR